MSGFRVFAAALLAVALAASATAQVPLQVHYQGYLTNAAGVPVNAATNITLRLYDTQAAPTALWSETHAAVPVANGNFSVRLGSLQALSLPIFDTARWLGVQAGADAEMTPRQQLGAAPFAAIAQQANTLAGSATVQGSQITGTVSNATVPGTAPWVASSASQQAAPNTAYMVTGATPSSITLPAAPAAGDIVKVSSRGLGGWTLVVSPGQTIQGGDLTVLATGGAWTPRESNRDWWSVASSADGVKLVAVVNGGQIHTSTDSGVSWTARADSQFWFSVASSADGARLVAAVNDGNIHTSTDGGVSWTPRASTKNWRSVASSTDGTKLAAVVYPGQIFTSPDSGANWTPHLSDGLLWQSIASSADGTRLAAVEQGGQIRTSIDSGANWIARESARDWQAVASSADGARLVAVVNGGQIYTSIDGGANWTPRASSGAWQAIASSTDGVKLAAVQAGGQVYTSVDGGGTWTARESTRNWQSVAASADCTRLVAVVSGGQIHTSAVTTRTGGNNSAAELVYFGGGTWVVVSQQGSLAAP